MGRDAGIAGAAAYVPGVCVERSLIGAAWGIPTAPGTRSAAGPDEDSLTLAVAAAALALEASGIPQGRVDLLLIASTTLPHQERQSAAVAAAALDLRRDVRTVDITGSLRAALDATFVATDAILAGTARAAIVAAADCRLAVPGSPAEQSFGDGAAAIVLTSEGSLGRIVGAGVTRRAEAAHWRSSDDRLVRTYETRLERVSGYGQELPSAAKRALEVAGVGEPDNMVRAYPTIDPDVGDWGAAAPMLALVRALEESSQGTYILWGAPGDGAAAALIVRGNAPATAPSFRFQLERRTQLTEYGTFAAARGLIVGHEAPKLPDVSAVAAWRREDQVMGRKAGQCGECGTRQYPPSQTCVRCGAHGTQGLVQMASRGTLYTFTLDHLANGVYQRIPTVKCVVDLEDGTRFFTEMSEGQLEAIRPGIAVELTFRLRAQGGGYRHYGWKCRPVQDGWA